MESRELRWRNQGLIFLILLGVLCAAGTRQGQLFVKSLCIVTTGKGTASDSVFTVPVMISLGALLVTFFGSAAIGSVINWLAVALICLFKSCWPGMRYSKEWEKLSVDVQERVTGELAKIGQNTTNVDKLRSRWCQYSPDVFLSYFWQQAPEGLVKWVSRRHTVYWSGMTTIFAAVLALLIFGTLTFYCNWNVVWRTTGAILVFTIILWGSIYWHARNARKEARQMVDIWITSGFDEDVGLTLSNILQELKRAHLGENENEARSEPYKIMRRVEVNKRLNGNDTRLYYCDADVDFVVTTISKPHYEPPHRHSKNTESYYVLQGRLTICVNKQREVLEEGDMIVVYPGACHSFETTGEKVCFCAIKKVPQLEDKHLC